MSTETEIKKVLYRFLQDGITSDDAVSQIMKIFTPINKNKTHCKHSNVTNRVCNKCKTVITYVSDHLIHK